MTYDNQNQNGGWSQYDNRHDAAPYRGGYQQGYGYQRQQPMCDVIRHVDTLRENTRYGNRLELNFVRWNGGDVKLDLRTWKNDGNDWRPGGGVSLTREDAAKLVELLTQCLNPASSQKSDELSTATDSSSPFC